MATGATTGMADSYNSNSAPQLATLVGSEHYIQCAINTLDLPPSSLVMIADFGSSLGSNSMQAIKIIFQCLRETGKIDEQRQTLVIFNDLSTNNWTSLFQLVAQESWCHGLASGRSFYEQCLPSNLLSVGYSSTALHWLSCKPMNLSKHCYSGFAEAGEERQAFQAQGRQDYDNFLKHRAEEFHLGGVLILAHCCVNEQGSTGCDQALHLAYKCAQSFLTPEELLEFNYPTYLNSYAECVDSDLLARHSFQLIKADFARIDSPLYAKYRDGKLTLDEFAHAKAEWIRSWSQSSLEQALKTTGLRSDESTEQVLVQIWTRYEQEVREIPEEYDDCTFCTYMALKKI